jgi:hypothetical protein
MEVIRELCSFEGRLTGTDAERRAANRLAERLRGMGRRAEVEPIHVHPQVWLIHAFHCAIGFAGSLIAIAEPAVGFGLVLVSALSLYLDFNSRLHLLRRLFFRRASQNVFSPGRLPDAAGRLILCAHLDVARTGYLFRQKSRRRGAVIPPSLRLVLGPRRLLFWSLASLLPVIGARMAGVEAYLLDVLQLIPTMVLMVSVFLLIDIELSDIVPGANDDASGVATALALAGALDADPPQHLDVCVLLTGGEECLMAGMRSFVRGHRREMERESTYFVVLEMVGIGNLHYLTAEGLAVTYRHSGRLAELCEAVSTASREGNGDLIASPAALATASDALPPTLAGYPAITICRLAETGLPGLEYHTPADTPERIQPEALEHTERFVLELVRALDRDVGRRVGGTTHQRRGAVI